jgi:hypothetical protein
MTCFEFEKYDDIMVNFNRETFTDDSYIFINSIRRTNRKFDILR